MRTKGISLLAGIAGLLALSGAGAQAASISFYLNQSNTEAVWPDGINYLQVTISDSVLFPGDIEFLVTPLASLTVSAGPNFGIQAFGFNTQGAANALATSNIIDPAGWNASENDNLDGFGSFEIREDTTGSFRQNPLAFRITGIAGDAPGDYAVAGAGGIQGAYYFAVHVAGMSIGPGSSYFGGNASVVPVPAAVWLFGSAIGALAMARRRNARD